MQDGVREPLRERLWRAAAPRSVLLSAGTPPPAVAPGIFSLYRAAILLTSIAFPAIALNRCDQRPG